MFYKTTYNVTSSEETDELIQPVLCSDFYEDDGSWKIQGTENSVLVCPNTTEISLRTSNDIIFDLVNSQSSSSSQSDDLI